MKETEKIELKKSMTQLKEEIISCAAMLNKNHSGTVIFGINDDGRVCGITIGKSTISDITQEIQNHLKPLPQWKSRILGLIPAVLILWYIPGRCLIKCEESVWSGYFFVIPAILAAVYIVIHTNAERKVIDMMTAKVFENWRSQAIRLPKECRFSSDEVLVNLTPP